MRTMLCPSCGTIYPEGSTICPRDNARLTLPNPFGPGTRAGEFIVEEKIGVGGMGEVWSGRHQTIGKRVAIKVLSERFMADRRIVTRFMNEAQAVNAIQNRNIVDIFSFGELPDGRPYFVMEFLRGKPLSTHFKERGPVPLPEIVELFGPICRALQAAHDHNIIHRDLKPDNIFLVLEEGERPLVKLLDFGIAKLANDGDGQGVTRTGAIFGTPSYMSPEQCEGAKNVDARADIYALGIILFEMLTGRTPFAEPDDGVGPILSRHLYVDAPLPSSMVTNRAIPPALDDLVLRTLAKKPADRPQRCADFYAELSAIAQQGEPPFQGAKPIYKLSGEADAKVRKTLNPASSRPGDYYASSQTQAPLGKPPAWRSLVVRLGAAAVFTGVAVGAYLFFATRTPAPVVAANALAAPTTPSPNVPASAPNPASTPATAPAEAASVPTPPSAPEMVMLSVSSVPKGAKVTLNGEDLGETPLEREILAQGQEQLLEVSKDGFVSASERFTPNQAHKAKFTLEKAAPAVSKTPKTKTPTGKGKANLDDVADIPLRPKGR